MDYLALINMTAVDGRRLIDVAESDWSALVPHCADWDLAGLVRHTGEIFAWMAAVVSTGEFVKRRTLAAPPNTDGDLRPWYFDHMERTLGVLKDADPATPVWTFSSLGDQRAAWWSRRLAVEVAIHRWDAEYAAEIDPGPLDHDVAAAGINEFVTEFLPGLLAADTTTDLPSGMLHLQPTDGAQEHWLDLDQHGPPHRDPSNATTTSIRGTSSDLLLWMTNRDPIAVDVHGNRDTFAKWTKLKR